ncbi:hypothetical protein [Streptomyces sp. NPDC095613]|uniref:hypothetical protein n=1 Tax=Streptomyces sp. NPDC095613 TaxID=3155540 RepID=UPI0033348456
MAHPDLPDIPVPDQTGSVERRAALVQAPARLPVRQLTRTRPGNTLTSPDAGTTAAVADAG